MGGHGKSGAEEKWPRDAMERMAAELKTSVKDRAGKGSGFAKELASFFLEALRSHLTLKHALLERFLTRRKMDNFKEAFLERRIRASPIPLKPTKRDLTLLAAGVPLCHYHQQGSELREKKRGLALYLDVSGSVMDHLPKILGILRQFRQEIQSVFQFSNHAVETSFETLLKGKIRTTYGTDFNCVAQSILERRFEKAILVTDGFAFLSQELKLQLEAQPFRCLTILFGDRSRCEAFEPFGDVVDLEDMVR